MRDINMRRFIAVSVLGAIFFGFVTWSEFPPQSVPVMSNVFEYFTSPYLSYIYATNKLGWLMLVAVMGSAMGILFELVLLAFSRFVEKADELIEEIIGSM